MMEVLLFPGVWHQPVLSACSGYQDAGTWIIAVCICPDYMDFVLFPHGKWKEIKQLLLQWVIVVCSRVAGWERVKLDVPWLGAPAGHCHTVLWEQVLSHKGKCVCVTGWFFIPTIYVASVRQDLLDHVKCFSVRQLLCPLLQRVVGGLMHVLFSLWNNLLKLTALQLGVQLDAGEVT